MNNSKTLIITTALLHALLPIAQSSNNVDVLDRGDLGYAFSYEHPQLGTQKLTADAISENMFAVSFVGHKSFLDVLETDGWSSSAETLALYLQELGDDFVEEVELMTKMPVGPDYVLLARGDEAIDIRELQSLLVAHEQGQESTASLDPIAARVVEVASEIVTPLAAAAADASDVLTHAAEELGDAAAAARDDVVAKADAAATKVDGKFRRIFRHPAAKYVAGAVVVGAGVALWSALRSKVAVVVGEDVVELVQL